MAHSKRLYYFSHFLLIIILSVYLLDLIMGGRLSALFELKPTLVIENSQYWRLFTFPLAYDTFEGIILFIITFFIFAPKLEDIFQNWLYPLILSLVVFSQGTLLTLIYWKSDIMLHGMVGISFFVLTIFSLINIKKRLVIFQRVYLHTVAFSLIITLTWFALIFIHSAMIKSYSLITEGIFSAIFGMTSGLIIFLQSKYTKNLIHLNKVNSRERDDLKVPSPEELSMAIIANNELRKVNKQLNEDLVSTNIKKEIIPDLISSEERLNKILDKINEKGNESLTSSEKKFLEDYSKEL